MTRYYTEKIKRVIMLLVTLFLLISLLSCSANWHVRQAVKKDPSLFNTTKVTKIDTVLIKTAAVDTLMKIQRDTLIVYSQKEKETGKDVIIKYRWNTDSIYIEADCPDPEVITKTETITQTIKVEPGIVELLKRFWWIVCISFLFGLVLVLRNK